MGILSGLQRKRPTQPESMWTIKKDTEILLGEPKDYPIELMSRLKDHFSSTGHVERAYLVQMYDPRSGEPPHGLIGVVMKSGSERRLAELAPGIGEVIKQASKEEDFYDLMDLSSAKGVGDHVISRFQPFYP